MAFTTAGLNFRATSGYVTDGTDEIYTLDDAYPTNRNLTGSGETATFGWQSTTNLGTRDRDATHDRRLAGSNRSDNSGMTWFRLDLPATGDWTVYGAWGDPSAGGTWTITVKDGVPDTTIISFANAQTGDNWTDGTGVKRTSEADWLSNNAGTLESFGGPSPYLLSVQGVFDGSNGIAHIKVVQSASGTTRGIPFGDRGTAFNGGRPLTGIIR